MNFGLIEDKILSFLQNYLKNSNLNAFSVGVSGGIDSAVVATLCAKIAPTYALIMPTKSSSKTNLDDALNLVKKLNIEYKTIYLDDIVENFIQKTNANTQLRIGNIIARSRMIILYDHSALNKSLVVGTTNKSEIVLGYGTIFGDLASALNPVANLLKTDIFEFAKYLKIDKNIINKTPSADLWEGQSDEGDFGYSYEKIDEVLKFTWEYCGKKNGVLDDILALCDIKFKQLLKQKFNPNLVEFISTRAKNNKFKSLAIPVAEIY
nr:NAD+ synthase [Campylobacter sp.]